MSKIDLEEYRREEQQEEMRSDLEHDYLDNGQCPECKEHSIILRDEPDENVWVCQACGKVFE